MMGALAVLCAAGWLGWGGAGCSSDPNRGYAFGASRSQASRTVAVPVFENQTFYHGLEAQLTDAIIKEIQRRTPWVVTPASAAQTTLSGTITNASLRTLSISAKTGIVEEQAVELTLDFTWRDASGNTLVARKNFKSLESFVPERGTNERIELGEHAAVQEMARAIVGEMRSMW